MKPFEIVAAPFTLWVAPVGTAFPDIDEAPSGSWIKLGTSGDRSETEEGVTVTHGQEINQVRTAGATGPVKAFRTQESMVVAMTLLDLSLEQYAQALNGNAVTTTAAGVGSAGFKALKLYQGLQVEALALLVRGAAGSAYGDDWAAQYEIPACFQSGSPEPVFTKGEPAGLALEFTALEDPDAATPADRFGRIVMQHAAALS
jgi:hypothetical protein